MATYIDPAPWDEDGQFWDTIEIAGKLWPGLATVDVTRGNKWDTKKAKGAHGGEREFNGADLGKVKIQIRCWTTEQLIALVDLLPDIEPVPGKEKCDAVSISHPVAIIRKCLSVTIDSVAGPKVQDRMSVLDIDCTEYRKPESKNASGTASGGGGKSSFNPANTSNCDTLTYQLNNLYGQQIQLKTQQEQAQNKLDNGEYDPTDLSSGAASQSEIQAQVASLEAARQEVANQVIATIAQQNALKCGAQVPSAQSATTDP